MSSNSYGNDNRGIRRFLRRHGVQPTVANVERIGREVRRTQAQNEALTRIHREVERERGLPSTVDQRGDVHARIREKVRRDLERGQA